MSIQGDRVQPVNGDLTYFSGRYSHVNMQQECAIDLYGRELNKEFMLWGIELLLTGRAGFAGSRTC